MENMKQLNIYQVQIQLMTARRCDPDGTASVSGRCRI